MGGSGGECGDSGDCGGGGHVGGGSPFGGGGPRDYGDGSRPGPPGPVPRKPPPRWLLALEAVIDTICTAVSFVLKPIVITFGILAGLAFACCIAAVLGYGLFEVGVEMVHLV